VWIFNVRNAKSMFHDMMMVGTIFVPFTQIHVTIGKQPNGPRLGSGRSRSSRMLQDGHHASILRRILAWSTSIVPVPRFAFAPSPTRSTNRQCHCRPDIHHKEVTTCSSCCSVTPLLLILLLLLFAHCLLIKVRIE
jgi:hypothetical protein